MTYETKIEELVGNYVAEYQREYQLGREIEECLDSHDHPKKTSSINSRDRRIPRQGDVSEKAIRH